MPSRLVAAAALAASLGLAGPVLAKDPAPAKTATPATAPAKTASPSTTPAANRTAPTPERESAGASTPAKQRQKACGAEWRSLSVSEKTAQGPKWPQFYSKCVKRLKAKKD